jgi:hypothetical protein
MACWQYGNKTPWSLDEEAVPAAVIFPGRPLTLQSGQVPAVESIVERTIQAGLRGAGCECCSGDWSSEGAPKD